MPPAFTDSRTSIRLRGRVVPGAEDRQKKVPGFDQEVFSKSNVVCVGAGGIVSQIAPTLVRKGIGRITLLDDDIVEPSNLNRQRFYIKDIGKNKAMALARNLQAECIVATEIYGYARRLEEAMARGINLNCDVVICGVDNNPARTTANRHFRSLGTPVIFTAVSADGDHGYVSVQDHTERSKADAAVCGDRADCCLECVDGDGVHAGQHVHVAEVTPAGVRGAAGDRGDQAVADQHPMHRRPRGHRRHRKPAQLIHQPKRPC